MEQNGQIVPRRLFHFASGILQANRLAALMALLFTLGGFFRTIDGKRLGVWRLFGGFRVAHYVLLW
jgi:hypothetical protein